MSAITESVLDQLYGVVQEFFTNNNLGSCDQTNDEELPQSNRFFTFKYASDNPCFETNGDYSDPLLSVDIGYNINHMRIDFIEFRVLYIEHCEFMNYKSFSMSCDVNLNIDDFNADVIQKSFEEFMKKNKIFYDMVI